MRKLVFSFENEIDFNSYDFSQVIANYYVQLLEVVAFSNNCKEDFILLQLRNGMNFIHSVSYSKTAMFIAVKRRKINERKDYDVVRTIDNLIVKLWFTYYHNYKYWKISLVICDMTKYKLEDIQYGSSFGNGSLKGLLVAKEIFREFYKTHSTERILIDASKDSITGTKDRRFNTYCRLVRDFPKFKIIKWKKELRNF